MTQRISAVQAASDALAVYLLAALSPNVTPLSVEPRWPDKFRDMPQNVITVIPAGARQVTWQDPESLNPPVLVSGNLYTYRYRIGEFTQPLQLDAWSLYDMDRNDMVCRLNEVLNVGASALGIFADPVDVGLLLALAGEWSASIAYYQFDMMQNFGDDSRETHYRAMAQGTMNCSMSVSFNAPKLTRVILNKSVLSTSLPYGATTAADISYVTSTGETYAVGTLGT